MARASLRRSSLRRHSRRMSGHRLSHGSRSLRNSLKDGLKVAQGMNESVWRKVHYFISRDGAGQYIALRKAALFFTMSFWTYFGIISVLCHMGDQCGPLEKTVKTIENLNGFLYWLLFASLVFGTVVFSLSAVDMLLRTALQSLDSASRMTLGSKSLRAHGGGDPEFMSSTMMRPRLRKSAMLLPSGPLPPPASPITRNRALRQSGRVTSSEKTPYRRPSRSGGGGRRRSTTRPRRSTTPAPSRGRSASRLSRMTTAPSTRSSRAASISSRSRASAGSTYRLRTRRRTMSRRLPRGAPIVRRSMSISVPNRMSLSRPVVARVHSTEAKRYYSLPGTLRQQRRSVDQTYTFRPPSLNINPAGVTYRAPAMTVQTRRRTYRRRY